MPITLKPPTLVPFDRMKKNNTITVFLAGSIEMGTAIDWQTRVVELCSEVSNLAFLNPRRDDWDSSWEQTIENGQFRGQVEWELDGLERADLVLFHLDENTKSPVSLLELGLMAKKGNVIVSCEPKFWRRGNVEVVCNKYRLVLFDNLEEAVQLLKDSVNSLNGL